MTLGSKRGAHRTGAYTEQSAYFATRLQCALVCRVVCPGLFCETRAIHEVLFKLNQVQALFLRQIRATPLRGFDMNGDVSVPFALSAQLRRNDISYSLTRRPEHHVPKADTGRADSMHDMGKSVRNQEILKLFLSLELLLLSAILPASPRPGFKCGAAAGLGRDELLTNMTNMTVACMLRYCTGCATTREGDHGTGARTGPHRGAANGPT